MASTSTTRSPMFMNNADGMTSGAAAVLGSGTTESLHEQKESAAFHGQRLSAVPSDLLTLRNVVRVDLSTNQLTRFPGELVANELPRVEVLLLQDNLLFVFEDVLALSRVPRLRELDVRRNPLRLQNNRVYLLEALFNARGCDEELLLMDFHDTALKHAGEVVGRSGGTSMRYRFRLPRRHGFPMLLKLNDEWITDREVKEVEAERGAPIEYFRPSKHQLVDEGEEDKTQRTSRMAKGTDAKTKLLLMMMMSTTPNGVGKEGKPPDRHFDGSRMTMRQIAANNARETAIPAPQMPQRFLIDVTTGDAVDAELEGDNERDANVEDESEMGIPRDSSDGSQQTPTSDAGDPEEVAVLRQIFRPSFQAVDTSNDTAFEASAPSTPTPVDRDTLGEGGGEDSKPRHDPKDDVEPWNYPVSTFDTLGSEDRHYVRAKSKQTGEMLERDDHFFASTPFVDCVVQCERSRRLTVRAVDLLASSSHGPSVVTRQPDATTSERAAALAGTLNAAFSREKEREMFARVMDFQKKRVVVNGETKIQSSVADYFLAEHMNQRSSTSQLLHDTPHASRASSSSAFRHSSKEKLKKSQNWGKSIHDHHHEVGPADTASVEASLSKTKLQNAVDLANSLVDHKQQRRMIQALIDADAKVIEEERVTQDQATHRRRLERIRHGQRPDDPTGLHEAGARYRSLKSPWQARNRRAKQEKAKQQTREIQTSRDRSTSNNTHRLRANEEFERATSASVNYKQDIQRPLSASASAPAFRDVTTVEKAALDPLAAVNSHELLVRCADIRQRASKHIRGLTAYRDRFLDEESEWERMRHDPTNVVRRHLHRRLYQDAPQVQIGATQYFYSPLFK